MKTNAIVRIIIFSVIIFILLGVLLAGLGIGVFTFMVDSDTISYTTTQEPLVCLDPSTIEKVQVEWVAGSIRVVSADSNEVSFSESGYTSDSNRMVWKQSGSTLTIRYREPAFQFGFFSEPAKDLTITIPQNWYLGELDIDTVSGNATIEGLTAREVDFDGTSATCTFTDCQIADVDISTVSGDIYYGGTLSRFGCDAVSARCELRLNDAADEIEMDGVSGHFYLYIPEEFGFSANLDSTSGDLNIDLETTRQGKRYVHGDGSCQIDMDTVSGNMNIHSDP